MDDELRCAAVHLGDPDGDDGRGDIWVVSAAGRPATGITSGEGVDSYPAWSANGERIAFVRSLDGERLAYLERDVVGDIWTLQVDEERF